MLTSFVVASLVTAASAHQNFHQFWVNGVSPGFQVGIRMPPSNSPVTDVTSTDIACNVGGTSGAGVATIDVKAGDQITVQWDQSTHPGPISHFLYGPVASAQGATGVGQWAKIDQLGYANGKWANEVMEAQDMKYTFTIPSTLASGEYLLRSEMLALHASTTLNGAQFYIGCAQIKVAGGSGICAPKISLPGAYKATDSNILIPDFYYGFQPTTYVVPGGPVATCGGSGPQPTTSAAVTTTSARPSTTTTLIQTTSTTLIRTTTTTARSSSTPVGQTTRPATTTTTTAASTGGGVSPKYGQCGGQGWTGPTVCAAGSTCTFSNQWYSQCL